MKPTKKNPKKVKAGRARWLSMSAKERKAFTSKAGKKGGAATKAKWASLQHEKVIQQGA